MSGCATRKRKKKIIKSELQKLLSTVWHSTELEQVWDVGVHGFSASWEKGALISIYFSGFILPQKAVTSIATANSEVPQTG